MSYPDVKKNKLNRKVNKISRVTDARFYYTILRLGVFSMLRRLSNIIRVVLQEMEHPYINTVPVEETLEDLMLENHTKNLKSAPCTNHARKQL